MSKRNIKLIELMVKKVLVENITEAQTDQWDVERVKDELPEIQAKLPDSKKVVTAKIYGRRNDYAMVKYREYEAEFSWKTLARLLNSGQPVQL